MVASNSSQKSVLFRESTWQLRQLLRSSGKYCPRAERPPETRTAALAPRAMHRSIVTSPAVPTCPFMDVNRSVTRLLAAPRECSLPRCRLPLASFPATYPLHLSRWQKRPATRDRPSEIVTVLL